MHFVLGLACISIFRLLFVIILVFVIKLFFILISVVIVRISFGSF
jgi:hypothetical protein